MSDDRFVTLARLHDPVRAELLVDLLDQAKIPVTSVGLNHRALYGMTGGFVEIVLQVPADRLEEARELVASLEAGAEHDAEDGEDAEDADGKEGGRGARSPSLRESGPKAVRLKRIAAFAAFVLPVGGGHFYAGRYRRAVALLLSQVLCIVLAVSRVEVRTIYLFGLGVVADLLGSFEAVEHVNTGARPTGASAVLGRTLPWIVPLLALVPLALRHAAPELYVGASGRAICEVASRCAGADEAQCTESLAQRLSQGATTWARSSECARCVEGRSCRTLYERRACEPNATEPSPTLGVSLGLDVRPLLGAPRDEPCRPEHLLRQLCYDACFGLLPERPSAQRVHRELLEHFTP